DLHDEVATTLPATAIHAHQVEASELVGLDQQAFDRRDPHARDAAFVHARIGDDVVDAIAILDLADAALHRRLGSRQALRRIARVALDPRVAGCVHPQRDALLRGQREVVGELRRTQQLAYHDLATLDRIGIRLAPFDRTDGNAMQQRRTCIWLWRRTGTTVHCGRVGHVGARGETTLDAHATHLGAVLPTIAIAVVEDRTHDQRFIKQRITDQLHIRRRHVRHLLAVVLDVRAVGVDALADARTDTQQVGDRGGLARGDVELVD